MEEFLWVEKYRPKLVKDIILPTSIKSQFKSFIEVGNIPTLLLAGPSGCGKTTAVRAMLEELGNDYIVINGSMDANIQNLRGDIRDFASSMSFNGGRKYVLLDEADQLLSTGVSPVQQALRNFTEEYSSNCGFILTCNFPEKIIDALHSRCTRIDFKISKSESAKLAGQFLSRVKMILDAENVTYDVKVLVEYITLYFPDWRKILNELQGYGMSGRIDTGILATVSDAEIKNLVSLLKQKNFKGMRTWVAKSDINHSLLCRRLFDLSYEFILPESIPPLVIILADYSYKNCFSIDEEINTVAMLTSIMAEINFI